MAWGKQSLADAELHFIRVLADVCYDPTVDIMWEELQEAKVAVEVAYLEEINGGL